MELSPEKKIAGILAPLFGLRSENDLGIGDVAVLREFIDWAAEIGFKLVQLLPINEMGGDNSPYNAISAIAIEPTTLHLAPGSPEDLTREDYESALADVDLTKLRHGAVKYGPVKKLKRRLLEKAFVNFSAHASQDRPSSAEATAGRQSKFRNFCEQQSTWLNDYAFFRALVEENGDSEAWDKWPPEHQHIESARAWLERQPPEKKKHFNDREDLFRYIQWIANEQWSAIKSYAEERGVALMGDIPFGVNFYSADVFARPDEFAHDWCGGAPPESHFKDDQFTQKWGQNWGIPLFHWDAMRHRNFNWWRQRVRSIRRSFHLFRIDHVLGFYRIYAFPWRPQQNKKFLPLEWSQMLERTGGRAPHFHPRDDSNPDNCEANRKEGENYLRAVLEESGDARVIGEDLGTVPDYVRPSLRSLGVAGFKIPHWEFYHGRVTPGAEYERLSVATYATHDHKPMRALWEEAFEHPTSTSEQARAELEKIAIFTEFTRISEPIDFEKHFYPAMMEALFKSESWFAIVMITDLLARKYRFNIPGTAASSNWVRRMQRSISQLRSSPKERKRMQLIRQLLEKTGRI
ncbi:MAG TPA: 4-alpha-glucanotransferase [Chthoniobacterales bacterium]|nr:4-alpha-glucanotransferase [Chthoniobacterales bacterium]